METKQSAFAGRLALVTGAAGGIGGAVVQALRAQGAHVLAVDRRGVQWPQERDLSEALEAPGVLALDVTDTAAVRHLVARIEAELGPIDTLVNGAGVVSFGSAQSLSEAEWQRVIDINLKGSFFMCQAVMAGMIQAQFGRIVNIGSVVGKNSGNARPWLNPAEQDVAGNVVYGISKTGVHTMTQFLAKELAAHGVTVNAVAPGPIATEMTTGFPDALRALIPVGRMGTLDDVARTILFLAAKETGFITGEVLDINGGMWCD